MTDEFVLGILILGGVDRDFKIINSEWFQKCKIHLFGFYRARRLPLFHQTIMARVIY